VGVLGALNASANTCFMRGGGKGGRLYGLPTSRMEENKRGKRKRRKGQDITMKEGQGN